MTTLHPHVSPVVRAAVSALDNFGALSQREARTLLGYWCRRDQLAAGEIDLVLAHFPDGRGYAASEYPTDPTGLEYDRADDDEPGTEPVPPHVHGWHVGGRGVQR